MKQTYFLLYLIHYLGKLGHTIVFDTLRGNECYLFKEDTVLKGTIESFESDLRNPKTWCLVDGKKPVYPAVAKAKYILATSPNCKIWWQFSKEPGSTFRYMPIWSWEEIVQLWTKSYSHTISKPKLENLYANWGGIPCYVLENANDHTQLNLLEKAIQSKVILMNPIYLFNFS